LEKPGKGRLFRDSERKQAKKRRFPEKGRFLPGFSESQKGRSFSANISFRISEQQGFSYHRFLPDFFTELAAFWPEISFKPKKSFL
jgi:hypothetical protein